uniref:Uncharacterized protein n=1 Tax=Solanum tuberosum TaxID=4113 RepID=M1DQB1_SOLTU
MNVGASFGCCSRRWNREEFPCVVAFVCCCFTGGIVRCFWFSFQQLEWAGLKGELGWDGGLDVEGRELDEEIHDKIYSCLYTSGSESDYDDDNSASGFEIDQPESSGNNQPATTDACKRQELRAYLSKKQGDTFASIAKDDIDDIKSYEKDYSSTPHKGEPVDNSVKHIARKISIQDANKEEMINEYLDEVRRNLLLNITHYEKSDTSKRSETSDEAPDETPQPCGDTLHQTEDFLFGLKGTDAAA